jgi:hypothetical protein
VIAERPLTAAEAEALNAEIPDDFSDYLQFREHLEVSDGPLTFDELDLTASLIVIGNVSCAGVLVVPVRTSLIVTGNLTAGAVIAEGKVIILGRFEAGDVVGDSFCNQVFCCKGDARVRCLIENGHDFEFAGALAGTCVASLFNVVRAQNADGIEKNFIGGMNDELRRDVFAPALFDAEGRLKSVLAMQQIHAGNPLLKS